MGARRYLVHAWEDYRLRRALRALQRGERTFSLTGLGLGARFRHFLSPFLAPPRPRTARILAAVLASATAAGIALKALLVEGRWTTLPGPPSGSHTALPGTGKSALVPPASVVLTRPMPERFHALIACRRDRTLYAYLRGDGGRWIKEAAFPMAFGHRSATGDSLAGSGATPEGRYWISSMLPGAARGETFGALIYFLAPAKAAGRELSSGVVWIHGTEAGRRPSYTRGHLALANDDVVALADYAGPATPVIILPDSTLPDPARQLDAAVLAAEYPAVAAGSLLAPHADSLRRAEVLAEARAFLAREAKAHPRLGEDGLSSSDRKAILTRLSSWSLDLERRDAEAVRIHYAPDFKDLMGRSLRDFLEKRSRQLAGQFHVVMELEAPEIVVESYGRVSVTFKQKLRAEDGEGESHASSRLKTLWLEQGPEGWLIVKE
ncbi:MAG TPA: L,D-transpeptidase [Fibrobacteria bacterium]|nr:L,D-transpeptidase [Fibrobacteria bacterium]